MTIRKFSDWGRVITRPEVIESCDTDADMAKIAFRYQSNFPDAPHFHLTRGSLAISLGGSRGLSESNVRELPIDLLRVAYIPKDDIEQASVAVNSVVMRHRFWRGQIVAITNGGYVGQREIAPRAHPNDGVFDVVEVEANMSGRQRLNAWRRLPTGTHIPHPLIHQRQGRSETWRFTSPIGLYLDEEFVGRVTQVEVTIAPDALKLVI